MKIFLWIISIYLGIGVLFAGNIYYRQLMTFDCITGSEMSYTEFRTGFLNPNPSICRRVGFYPSAITTFVLHSIFWGPMIFGKLYFPG